MRAAVMGAGSWGTSVAKVLVDAGTDTVIWARRPELAEAINTEHVNADYLPGIALPAALTATSSAVDALLGADVVVCGVPSQSLRPNLTQWTPYIGSDASLVSLAKGIESNTLLRMSEVIAEVTGVADDRIAVLTGPNLAREIAEGQPAATVIACADEARAVTLQSAFSTRYFRPYTNTDVVGCEIGGSAKNVIALACGMASGIGFGQNTLATIITRGLAETIRLGVAVGAQIETLAGLAGIGDLVATCSSPLSRNRTFGARLGEGATMAQAQEATNGQVAEGVKSCSSVRALAERHQVPMPLTDAVHQVCHDGMSVADAVNSLLGRSTKPEIYRD
ncbi:NAD(P)H-dependent glycerol-3-phosphate dehydrogenase [Gordonia sp. JH63]|uniref:Glycerol-3-phosphate dehydrogenase [NAD(P)+] n=1 Tax=Gordonia hongkongensis TaxID=1701090 RepID=A0AAX3T3R1_9ACTN|nr:MULTISPECIES: NAD(P)H-dependent glycerol-3-phosphate dehydrogenase [Gordonia]MCZ4535628.1 NAD(P)-dependent glycerol-3-phosphate dehydrogenase [Gordonia terrae]OCW87541.1 glycerol-3-phosphate dehydrogenase [Nocardia farcinica]MBN0972018.1 NAD(P)-dependent glycerol-3-phosphate dehydrogenase [Gordonia sp. BP-119]MBN0982873.1 NAD(P)-dependent glycerol-3-phosphate dehydrogenase [Gordonia sp. BP-94]MBR7195034.1 NAD(P)-dependent glycerol-3-phosphate dehydrogenase [Gordonia sp. SCSIO 19800]